MARPLPSTSSLDRAGPSNTDRIVMPIVESSKPSKKASKSKQKKREEPSIFQVDLPLDMLSDSVIDMPSASAIEAAHSTHQPIYIEVDEAQRSAMAGGDMILGMPEDEDVVFVNVDKHERLAKRGQAWSELDTVLASMA